MDKEKNEKKTIKVKSNIDPSKIEIKFDTESINQKTFELKQNEIKHTGSGHPTYKPTNYKEQFYFEDNGSLWINIGNTWKEFIPA